MATELLGSLPIGSRLEVEDVLSGETALRPVAVEVYQQDAVKPGTVRLRGCDGDIVFYEFPVDTAVVDGVILFPETAG